MGDAPSNAISCRGRLFCHALSRTDVRRDTRNAPCRHVCKQSFLVTRKGNEQLRSEREEKRAKTTPESWA
jgi:hypothetical protein